MAKYLVEYTDLFAGEANYSWVKKGFVEVPCLSHYGYTGCCDGTYTKADKAYRRELMKQAKAFAGLTGVKGRVDRFGDCVAFYPYKLNTVLFITYAEEW